MRKQNIELIKDFFISILIIACIGIVLTAIFYDKISLSKVIPETQDYMLSEEMQQELENTILNGAEEMIVNYYINATDLKKYEKTNEYVKGKSNPFAIEDIIDTNDTNNTVTGGNSSSNTNNNNTNSGNFYEDDGTK